MPIDEALLERHRVRVDEAAGVREEFLQPALGGARTVAVLTRPLRGERSMAWVVCHSFGIEHVYLNRLDVVASRELAGAGFPVLRFHAQGYGESGIRGEPVQLRAHMAGAEDAVRYLREHLGAGPVGVLGGRFGAMVAALVADRMELPAMALWQPTTSGASFMGEFVQSAMFGELSIQQDEGAMPRTTWITSDLRSKGWSDVNGFLLTREAFDGISDIDLTRQVRRFRGSALVVGVSRSGSMPPGPARAAEHLRSIGASCDEVAIADIAAPVLGQNHWRKFGQGRGTRDEISSIVAEISGVTVAWALRLGGGA